MRLLPMPWVSLAIVGLWLVLVSAFTINSLVMGAIVAVAVPLATHRFWPDRPVLAKPLQAIGFFFLVCGDILVANFQLAGLILGPIRRVQPLFVDVPLDIDDPFIATILASIVSLTPGTVSVDIDREARILSVHAFSATDGAAVAAAIKQRYEGPLKEIFAC
jgi:multicomponent K+:H+ antiporter subunit E